MTLSHVTKAKNSHRCETRPFIEYTIWAFSHAPKSRHDLNAYCAGRARCMIEEEDKGFAGEHRGSIFLGSTKSLQMTWNIYINSLSVAIRPS